MIKDDFPILKDLTYLDNAATTQKPIQVINAIRDYYLYSNANIHRGLYPLSLKATELYEKAHEVVAEFIGGDWREIIFVRNATEGLNLAAWVFGEVSEGRKIITTLSEHHSNMLPWWRLAKKKNWDLVLVKPDENGIIDPKKVAEVIDEETAVVALQHASNVTGNIVDLRPVVKKAKEYGIPVVVDGAQSVPHVPIDVKKLGIDALAFSAHKMLGPTGIGAVWIKKEYLEAADPFLLGGDMIKEVHWNNDIVLEWNELPWKFEAGTPNIAGAVGFMEAVKYLENYGVEKILPHGVKLAEQIREVVESLGFEVLGGKGSIVSFYKKGMDPYIVAFKLGQKNVCVRAGYHCAQPLHEYFRIMGTVRASVYIYNDEEDVERFEKALKEVVMWR